MKSLHRTCPASRRGIQKQRGVVLFLALIALVTIMLAATALMRSVDTGTVIAGNLAFKQSATTSGDGGLSSAIAWMSATNAANPGVDPFLVAAHPFNNNNAAAGYYATVNLNPAFPTTDATWVAGASADGGTDVSGNQLRYIIERMCRAGTAGQVLSTANCLFSDWSTDTDTHLTGQERPIKGGSLPINRVTIRVTGQRNTVSYIQAFIF
jgi:type IV pilus assembly protein PilX